MDRTLRGKPKQRWLRRKHARPDEILSAALELFAERGFAGTRLEDVAARAGVSKGTLYLYFANKHELFKAVVRQGSAPPIAEACELIEAHDGAAIDLLRMIVRRWWEQIGSPRVSGIPKLVIAEARNFPQIAEFYVAEVMRPAENALRRVLERGVASGEFRSVDPDAFVQLVIAPALLVCCWNHSLRPHEPHAIDPVRVLEAHLELLRRGLATPGAPPADGARPASMR